MFKSNQKSIPSRKKCPARINFLKRIAVQQRVYKHVIEYITGIFNTCIINPVMSYRFDDIYSPKSIHLSYV